MKKKHKRLLSIILCCSMMLGLLPFAAMAEDAAPATDPFADATTIYVSNTGGGDGTSETTPTTLKEAVKKINNATQDGDKAPAFIISLTENLEFLETTVVKDGDFTLKKYNTMILGNGHTMKSIIGIKADGTDTNVYLGNAEKNAFTINVDSDSSPTLAAGNGATIHMYDGVVVHHGPANAHCNSAIALHQTGKFKMYGGEISNCHTLTGTIFADDSSSITILGGSIHDNNCILGSDGNGNGNGGAICLHNQSELTIDGNVVFKNNASAHRGGAIYSQNSTVSISGNTQFINNTATKIGGGAIFKQYGNLIIDGATFSGNSAFLGGAIAAVGGNTDETKTILDLSNCKFTQNTTTENGTGGAMFIQNTKTTLTDCTVENNTASKKAGGIYSNPEQNVLTLDGKNLICNNKAGSGDNAFDSNLYLEVIGNGKTAPQSTLFVDENFDKNSNIGVTMETIAGAEESEKPEASVPFSVNYSAHLGDAHPSNYFFSDDPTYRVDWSEDKTEARLVKGAAEYKLSMNPTELYFSSKNTGYVVPPAAKTVTVTNDGNMPTSITLPNDGNYIFTPTGDGWDGRTIEIPVGGEATFTVQPAKGLPAANYDDTVNVAVKNSEALALSLLFTVNKQVIEEADDDIFYFALDKIDGHDGMALKGAEFGLYLDGKKIATATSNKNGVVLFHVSEKNYKKINKNSDIYYKELTAPKGYVLDSDKHYIDKKDLYRNNQNKAKDHAKLVKNYEKSTKPSKPSNPSVPGDLNGVDHHAYVFGFADGTVKPNNSISRAETATMLYRLLTDERRDAIHTTTNPFTDVSVNAWYNEPVSTMANGKYIMGYTDGTFGGQNEISRAEFVAMLTRFVDVKKGSFSFTDVPKTHWAYDCIATATQAGWIKGYTDGTFKPNQSITRAEAMSIINRVLDRGVSRGSELLSYKVWPDNSPTEWYYYEIIEATNDHEYTGTRPNENWTSLAIH